MSKPNSSTNIWTVFYIPYIVLAAIYFPLYTGYCLSLWNKLAHYQFFPFLLVAVGYLVYDRWPKDEPNPLRNSTGSPIFLAFSALFYITGLLFSESTFIAFGFALGVSSFLLRIKDKSSGGSLFPISLLLYIIVHAPFGRGYDQQLISALQVWSSQITSLLLDTVGILHDMPGTILKTPEKEWGVEQACSGVQSFFTLLFCSTFWAIWKRRPWFRGGLLVASTVFWAIAMNTIRIFAIPYVYYNLNQWDLSTGWQHAVLGYFTLTIGILMIISTDYLLDFLFGPIEADQSNNERQSMISSIWNRFISGGSSFTPSGDWTPNFIGTVYRFALVGVSAVCLIGFFPTVYRALTADGVNFMGDGTNVIRVSDDWLPKQVGAWKLVGTGVETREIGSDLGQRTNYWIYQNGNTKATFSLDQAFPGWHELTTCYKNSKDGWKVSDKFKRIKNQDQDTNGDSWIEVGFESPTAGGVGVLFFGHDSGSGTSLDAPGDWSFFTSTWKRLMNRMSPQVRGQIFSGVAYQTQLFGTYNRFPEGKNREELRNFYNQLRDVVQKRLGEQRTSEDYMSEGELANDRKQQEALKEKLMKEKKDQKKAEDNKQEPTQAKS